MDDMRVYQVGIRESDCEFTPVFEASKKEDADRWIARYSQHTDYILREDQELVMLKKVYSLVSTTPFIIATHKHK
jgi:hypothetical protein